VSTTFSSTFQGDTDHVHVSSCPILPDWDKVFDFGAGWWHEEDMLEMAMAVTMITVLEDIGKLCAGRIE
jgi:hypothetical protein